MRASRLHPELRASFRFAPNPPVRHSWGRAITRMALRLVKAPPLPGTVTCEVIALRTPGVSVRVFTPHRRSGAALLWLHGGGMVIGAAVQDDLRCATVADTFGLVVVSADYRLAPEYPFPAPLDDCEAAWAWLLDHAGTRGIDPARVAIGGQSAGGGLAAGLVLRLHDATGPQPAAQWLFCPMLDDRTAADRHLDPIRHFLWNNRSNRAGWSAYLGVPPGSAGVPDQAAPARRADLTGLPPTWIGAGTIELFYEEDRAYAASLAAAGGAVTFDAIDGAPHAFESIARSAPITRAYLDRANDWLASALKP